MPITRLVLSGLGLLTDGGIGSGTLTPRRDLSSGRLGLIGSMVLRGDVTDFFQGEGDTAVAEAGRELGLLCRGLSGDC